MTDLRPGVAFFVSPHGFGHAARAAAVMEALGRIRPAVRLEIFTRVPEWFFEDSAARPFHYHRMWTDVGLEQRSALEEDSAATVETLRRFFDGFEERAARAAGLLQASGCRLVVCDVSALGLEAARRAGLPSVLVENFTWDWIYRPYLEAEPRLGAFADRFAELDAAATERIQMIPVCERREELRAVPPVARPPRARRAATRRALRLDPDRPAVLLTMGGIPWSWDDATLSGAEATLVALSDVERIVHRDGLVLLPWRSPVYLPDVVAAVDAVVAKVGYSTVAEAWRAGQRMGFVRRPRFPESDVLADFVEAELPAVEIPHRALADGSWIERLPDLLARERPEPRAANGADTIALRLAERLG